MTDNDKKSDTDAESHAFDKTRRELLERLGTLGVYSVPTMMTILVPNKALAGSAPVPPTAAPPTAAPPTAAPPTAPPPTAPPPTAPPPTPG